MLQLNLVQLVHSRSGMFQSMPSHLQDLLRSITGPFVGLTSRNLREVVDLIGQLVLHSSQRFEEGLRVVFRLFETGLFLAQLQKHLTWGHMAYQ